MNSLLRTILAPITALLAAFCLAAAAASFVLVTREANKFLDAQLQEIAINTSKTTPMDVETGDEDRLVVRVWDRSGAIVYRGGPSVDIPWTHQPGLADAVVDGQMWRVYRWSTAHHNALIAQAWSARREIAAFAAKGAALPLLLAVPLAWLLIRWSIGRTLREFHRLSSAIGNRSLEVRESLQPKDIPTEIVPLIAAINQLVERYRQALETQRRFVADAAHELRTPLAALQIQTDNLLASDLSKQSRELANELGDGVRRSSHLAHQLLEMARSEGSPAVCNRTIDLAALITSILTEFVTLACASGIHLERDIVNPASVDSDDTAVRKILSILIDNAICYSSRDSVVTVKLSLIENQPRIDVMDSGAGIPIDALPFIYDRFYRGASQEIEGSGLGLAIAKAAADRNNIRLLHQRRTDVQGTVATMVFNQCSAELELSDLSVSAVDSSFGTG